MNYNIDIFFRKYTTYSKLFFTLLSILQNTTIEITIFTIHLFRIVFHNPPQVFRSQYFLFRVYALSSGWVEFHSTLYKLTKKTIFFYSTQ